ncbi:MAG: hypothetical protein IT462_17340 [Planctomycetes bacterium]|nr:hypothetical protein [Planctomycetota bacterium]
MRWKVSLLMLLCAMAALSACSETRAERREERMEDREERLENMSEWTRLGERTVNYGRGADHDTIMVTARDGRFKRIMLKVEGSALELYDVEVTFGDGEKWSPNTRLVFAKNTTSRSIDLPGEARFIRKVEFKYDNLPRGGRAQMELWGKSN